MIQIYYIILFLVPIVNPFPKTVNSPPEVRIVLPEEGAEISMSSSARYLVSVSDKEDGSTEYGEIKPGEVHLELSCWPNMKQAIDYRSKISAIDKDPPGLSLIKRSGCFSCHQDKTRLTGPSFADIAIRYSSDSSDIRTVVERVINGSAGIWGDEQMPANRELAYSDVLQAIEYILKQGRNKKSCIYSGYQGAIRPINELNESSCVYVLATYYTDKGNDGIPGTTLRGQHSILLK